MEGRQARGAGAATRLKAKLKSSLEQENYYEAHQIYKTLNSRLSAQKCHDELEEMLHDGATRMLAAKQDGSGADLAKLYLENMMEGGMKPDEDRMSKVVTLYASIPDELPDKDQVKGLAVKWSGGHPRLHQLLGFEFWRQRRYPEARLHFFQSYDGANFGQMMAEFHIKRGLPSELDLFVAAAVLQMLARKKHHQVAAVALKSYCEVHPKIRSGPPFKHPLINFCWLLLLAVEQKESLQVFTTLVEKYRPSLKRDISFNGYLDKIGQLYFGVPAPEQQRPGGMFSGIFDSLMSAFNEDDDEDEAMEPKRGAAMKDEDLD